MKVISKGGNTLSLEKIKQAFDYCEKQIWEHEQKSPLVSRAQTDRKNTATKKSFYAAVKNILRYGEA